MIRTDLVVTLRDLRGEHPPEVRRIPWGQSWTEREFIYIGHLVELAGVALAWRPDEWVPDFRPAERDVAAMNLVKDIAQVIRGERAASLYGADCSLVQTWEPSDPAGEK